MLVYAYRVQRRAGRFHGLVERLPISLDGGLVLLRAVERRLGLAKTLAGFIRE